MNGKTKKIVLLLCRFIYQSQGKVNTQVISSSRFLLLNGNDGQPFVIFTEWFFLLSNYKRTVRLEMIRLQRKDIIR